MSKEHTMSTTTLDEQFAALPEFAFVVRPLDVTCRFCGEAIPLFVDSAFYCCFECRELAYMALESDCA
jgi:hypothetical protein